MLATVTDKGQVTVPKEIRDKLGIVPGARLDFRIEPDGSIRIRPLTRGAVGLVGLLHDAKRSPSTVGQMNEAVGRYLAADSARTDRKTPRRR